MFWNDIRKRGRSKAQASVSQDLKASPAAFPGSGIDGDGVCQEVPGDVGGGAVTPRPLRCYGSGLLVSVGGVVGGHPLSCTGCR